MGLPLLLAIVWMQIDQVGCEDARPNYVDLKQIHVAGACRQHLLEQRQAIVGKIGALDEPHPVPGSGGPALRSFPAETGFDAYCATGDRDLHGPGHWQDRADQGRKGQPH